MGEPESIRAVRQAEYSGRQGTAKTEHCARFTAAKDEAIRKTKQRLTLELRAAGEAVSCRRGCNHCCLHYITASVAEGLVIVDFLYRNEAELRRFVENYPRWQARAGTVCTGFDRLRSLAQATGTPVEAYRASVGIAQDEYAAMAVGCPFLTGPGDCAIYAVRPLACAIHCSVDPPEKCAPDSLQAPKCYNVVPDEMDIAALSGFWKPGWSAMSMTMPAMVYGLLTRGNAFIDESLG